MNEINAIRFSNTLLLYYVLKTLRGTWPEFKGDGASLTLNDGLRSTWKDTVVA